MALTPLDIYNKEFKRQPFGGLNKDEVDDFLDEVMHEMETLIKENATLKEQLGAHSVKLEQYRTLEDALNRTLLVAQSTADDIKANARREADLIIQEARLQAERLIEAGHVKARRLLEEQSDMMRLVDGLRNQLRNIAHEMLRTVDHLPNSTEYASGVVEANNTVKSLQGDLGFEQPSYGEATEFAAQHAPQGTGYGYQVAATAEYSGPGYTAPEYKAPETPGASFRLATDEPLDRNEP